MNRKIEIQDSSTDLQKKEEKMLQQAKLKIVMGTGFKIQLITDEAINYFKDQFTQEEEGSNFEMLCHLPKIVIKV